jgi:uncharacterized protein
MGFHRHTAYYAGIWSALFPSSSHDTNAPSVPDNLVTPTILVFSKTNGFRHRDGIQGGLKALQSIADTNGWGVYATENGAIFNDQQLSRFDAVVFLNATGDMLDATQKLAFQLWLENRGGWLGIHAAGDGSHKGWDWYMDNLIGARFIAHTLDPHFQRARVLTENDEHPVNLGQPPEWFHEEEWYSWEESPRDHGFTVLATVDESTYQPVQKLFGRERDLSMGDHPVVWSNCVGAGRSVYAAMGHKAEAFEEVHYLRLLENALHWIIGLTGGDEC